LILVISNIANEAAPVLVNMFPPGAAFLITASDFYKTVKAEVSVNDFASSIISFDGKKISSNK
jgi:hypothetical protein